jgi:hypothetical protein
MSEAITLGIALLCASCLVMFHLRTQMRTKGPVLRTHSLCIRTLFACLLPPYTTVILVYLSQYIPYHVDNAYFTSAFACLVPFVAGGVAASLLTEYLGFGFVRRFLFMFLMMICCFVTTAMLFKELYPHS